MNKKSLLVILIVVLIVVISYTSKVQYSPERLRIGNERACEEALRSLQEEREDISQLKDVIAKNCPGYIPKEHRAAMYGYGSCDADLNGDGIVDASDLLIAIGDWGCEGSTCEGDANGDEIVNIIDLLIVTTNWGDVCELWSHSLGRQRIAVMLIRTPGSTDNGKMPEEVYDEIFNEDNEYSFANYVSESSYGKTWIEGVVTPWLIIEDYNNNQLVIDTADPFIDYSVIDRLMFIIAREGGGGGIGGGTIFSFPTDEGEQSFVLSKTSFDPIGGYPDFSRYKLLNTGVSGQGNSRTIAHEFGHGLIDPLVPHAGEIDCEIFSYILNGKNLHEFCDASNTEGFDQIAWGNGHHNPIIKERIGWLDSQKIIEIDTDGIYELKPYELDTTNIVLKIKRDECEGRGDIYDSCGGDGEGWYYLNFRRNIGHDRGLFFLDDYWLDGVEIRIERYLGDGRISHLVKMANNDRVLKEGETFVDPHKGTRITTLSISDESAIVQVEFIGENICGNGLREGNEECDLGDLNDESCEGYLFCNSDCTFDTSYCFGFEGHTKVFVSSTTYSGNLEGLQFADMECQTLAQQAGLDGNWKAWLSNSTDSAAERLYHSENAYLLLDNTPIAQNWEDLTDGNLMNPISLTEQGDSISEFVYTGTSQYGNGFQTQYNNCDEWSSTSTSGMIGYSDSQYSTWTKAQGIQCYTENHLYCFEQP